MIIESYVNKIRDTDFSISSDELRKIEEKAWERVRSIKVYASTTDMSLKIMVNDRVVTSPTLKATIEGIILSAYE